MIDQEIAWIVLRELKFCKDLGYSEAETADKIAAALACAGVLVQEGDS